MKRNLWLLVLAALIPHFSMAYAASVPALVNYQGKLTDARGADLATGEYDLYFRIWNDPMAEVIASNLVWGEKHVKVPVVRGMFNVILGGGTPLADLTDAQKDIAQAFNGSARYVGIAVGNADISAEIKPRQQILSSPFAMNAMNGVPTGTIVSFYGTTAPEGWLLCNGGKIEDLPEYQALKKLLGKSTTPDLRGRVILGLDKMGTTESAGVVTDSQGATLGGTSGYENHKLTMSEIPSHNHKYNDIFLSEAKAPTAWGFNNYISMSSVNNLGSHGGTDQDNYGFQMERTSSRTGGEEINNNITKAHNNLQPFMALSFIIKY